MNRSLLLSGADFLEKNPKFVGELLEIRDHVLAKEPDRIHHLLVQDVVNLHKAEPFDQLRANGPVWKL